MRPIGEGVDDRLVGSGRELNEVGMAAHPGHDEVDIPIEDPGRIADGLAPPELHVLLTQSGRGATEAGDADLERHPRTV